jgi:nanoRNase/pAp phosphatase (c-di-AMP/oligoRNAs hydrolase)
MLSNTDYSLFIKVIKAVTNFLAEKAGRFGVTVFWDEPSTSDLIQFRIRLSKNVTDIDLRKLLDTHSITDGGGHPGAIGFRFPRTELADPAAYVQMLLAELETL